MPPMAQHGTTVVSLQSRISSGSAWCLAALVVLGRGAEGDVVRTGFGGGDGAVAAGTAGHPDYVVRAQEPPSLGVGHVLLADMHPVAIEFGGEVGAVVHDERDPAILGDRLQDLVARRMVSSSTSFRRSCRQATSPPARASSSSLAKAVGVEGRRRDQVEPRGRPRLVAQQRVSLSPDRS